MIESRMKDRVKGALGATSPVNDAPEAASTPSEPLSDAAAQRQALQVLTLAQRTADEHVASAHRQADKICSDARAQAEQIVQEAKAKADGLGREADKALSEARASATKMGRDAQAHAEKARQNVEKVLADARAQADEIGKEARAKAEELKLQAQQRYEDVVGSLATKREALQQQIEALEQFDREYRARLTTFMQTQLRALWVDQPQVTGEVEPPAPVATKAPVPAQATASDHS